MPVVNHPGAFERGPSLSNSAYMYIWRGRVRAAAWPRTRGRRRHPNQLWWQEWFRQANILAKYAPREDREASLAATKGTLWQPRDMQIKAMAGRLWSIGLPDGRVLYSRAVYNDVSQRLDVITQVDGSLIVRENGYWVGLEPGPSGYVLTSQGAGKPPIWTPAPTGAGGDAPPSPEIFSLWVNQLGATVQQRAGGPLLLLRPPAPGGTQLTALLRQLATPPHAYDIAFTAALADYSGTQAGLCIYDSASNRFLSWTLRWDTSSDVWDLAAQRWSSPTSYTSQILRQPIAVAGRVYLRITDDGQHFRFSYSLDPAAWYELAAEQRTNFLAAPDYIGLCLIAAQAEPVPDAMAVYYWSDVAL